MHVSAAMVIVPVVSVMLALSAMEPAAEMERLPVVPPLIAPPMVTLPASVIVMAVAGPAVIPAEPIVAPVVLNVSPVMLAAPAFVSVAVFPEMVQPEIVPVRPLVSVIV